MSGECLLSIKGVAAKVSLSASRIYELINEGAFPLPLAIGTATRWRGANIDSWILEVAAQPRGNKAGRTAPALGTVTAPVIAQTLRPVGSGSVRQMA